MRKRGKQLVSLILAGALAGSLAGCMPTQSKETAAAPAKTQDTKAAENAAGADPEAAGADTEAAASADMEVNTTDPITLRLTGGEGIPAMKRHLRPSRHLRPNIPT